MLEFGIFFNISKKKLKNENENKSFCLKCITCMFKASNNNFGNISKIKIPKIISFCNLKSAKIAKKCGKLFSASILEGTTCTKHYKNYSK